MFKMLREATEMRLPWTVKWGWVLTMSWWPLGIAYGLILTAFGLDETDDAGLFLVPFLVYGGIGVILLIIGWLLNPIGLGDKLLGKPDKEGGWVRPGIKKTVAGFATIIMILFYVSSPLIFRDAPLWAAVLILYAYTAAYVFVLFLAVFYKRPKHKAATTYVNIFRGLPAFYLISAALPLVVYFTVRYSEDQSPGNGLPEQAGDDRPSDSKPSV